MIAHTAPHGTARTFIPRFGLLFLQDRSRQCSTTTSPTLSWTGNQFNSRFGTLQGRRSTNDSVPCHIQKLISSSLPFQSTHQIAWTMSPKRCVGQRASLTLQWIEEVRSICGASIPVILVACKVDLRDKAMANGTFNPANWIDAETVSFSETYCWD